MNDLIVSGFVYTDQLIQHATKVEKGVAAHNKRLRRVRLGLAVYAGFTTVLVVLLVIALDAAVPAIRLVPILLHTSDDGVTDAAVTTDSLPGNLPDAAIQAWLWQYVLHRESYSWTEADDNHYVVEAMSSDDVGKAYDNWISGKNPQSYQSVYGDKAVIRVGFREVTDYVPATKAQAGKITIHFARQIYRKGAPGPEPEETYSVTLRFLKDYPRGIRVRDILSFNPARLVITDYPGAEPLAAMRPTASP